MFVSSKLFEPSAAGGEALRRNVGAALADSLEHIFEASASHLAIPEKPSRTLLSRLRDGSLERPALYARHFDLIEAIQSDDLKGAQALLNTILTTEPVSREIVVSGAIGGSFDGDAESLFPYFAAEEDAGFVCVPADEKTDREAISGVKSGLALIGRTAAPLLVELKEVIRWILLAKALLDAEVDENPDYILGGSSALRTWGAILLNAEKESTTIERAFDVLHEHAHNVMFAVSPKEGVVTNGTDERYGSPLRADPRPLEGIYHATFVIARLNHAARTMLESGSLDADEEAFARNHLASRDLFFDGLRTLEKHADFTEEGRAAMEQAEAYMRSSAA